MRSGRVLMGLALCFGASQAGCSGRTVDIGNQDGTLENEGVFVPAPDSNGTVTTDPDESVDGTDSSGCGPQFGDRWLVFDSTQGLERRIFMMEPGTGQTLAVTDKSELSREPAISPDGSTLAYAVGEELRLMNLSNGGSRRLLNGDQPAWSPSGDKIAYHHENAVWLVDLAGENPERIAFCDTCYFGGFQNPTFLDSQTLIVDRENQITIIDLTTLSLRDVVMNWTTTMSHPSTSSDGSWVAVDIHCYDEPSIWLNEVALTTEPCEGRRIGLEQLDAMRPSWGTGSLIAYEARDIIPISMGRTGADQPVQEGDIAISNVESGEHCLLERAGDDRNPSWAPEGFSPP